MTTPSTNAREYHRQCNRRKRAKQLMHRRLAVAGIALGLSFLFGFIAGNGISTSASDKNHSAPAPSAPALMDDVEQTTQPSSAEATILVQTIETMPVPVRHRDDIVSGDRMLSYELQEYMQDCCDDYNVPYALALAIAEVETHFDPDAVSPTGDHGLMQINEINHEWLSQNGIDVHTYEGNIEGGIFIIADLLDRFETPERALMAYNCGPTGARNLWDAGVYETDYSRKVLNAFDYWTDILEG